MIRVVYMSSASDDLTGETLSKIVEESKERNHAAGITGMLLVHDGSVVQVVEGPENAVNVLMARIEADPRHIGVMELLREPMGLREFADWSMGLITTESFLGLDRRIVSDGLGGLSESGRAQRLLQSFARLAR